MCKRICGCEADRYFSAMFWFWQEGYETGIGADMTTDLNTVLCQKRELDNYADNLRSMRIISSLKFL